MIRRIFPLALLSACLPLRYYGEDGLLVDQLEREVIALQQTRRSLERQLETCGTGQDADPIYQELTQVLTDPEIRVERRGAASIVRIPADLIFTDTLALRDEATMPLDVLATAMAAHPGHTLEIEAHTDDRSPPPHDPPLSDAWDLSYLQTKTLRTALVDRFGVAGDRITLAPRADGHPLASNDTPAGQSKNRRILFVLVPPDA